MASTVPATEPGDRDLVAGPFPANDELLGAIFRTLTDKPSSIFQLYRQPVVVEFEDLKQLSMKIDQFFRSYNVLEKSFGVEISFDNHRRISLSSLEEFENFDTSQSESVREISMEINTLLYRANSANPENYKLEFSVRNSAPDIVMFIHSFDDTKSEGLPTLRSKVEFVDYIIGRNLASVVEDWVQSLPQIHIDSFIFFLRMHVDSVGLFLRLTAGLAPLPLVWALLSGTEMAQWTSFLTPAAWSAAIFLVSAHVGTFLSDRTDRFLRRLGPYSKIRFTRGDDRAFERLLHRRKSIARKAVASAATILVVAFVEVALAYAISQLM